MFGLYQKADASECINAFFSLAHYCLSNNKDIKTIDDCCLP
jgi:hypothetical protein